MSKLLVAAEFWGFMKDNKKFWLLPIVIVLALLGFLMVIAKTSALSPFIYALF